MCCNLECTSILGQNDFKLVKFLSKGEGGVRIRPTNRRKLIIILKFWPSVKKYRHLRLQDLFSVSAEAHRLTFCWENLGIFLLVPSVTDLLISFSL